MTIKYLSHVIGKWVAVISVVTLAVLTSFSTHARPVQFENDDFSLVFPSGWVRVPTDVLDGMQQVFKQKYSSAKVGYDYAFQYAPKDVQWFSYPYILIKVEHTGRLSIPELTDIVNTNNNSVKQRLQRIMGNSISELEFGKSYYDPISRVVWLKSSAVWENSGTVTAIAAFVPTEYGLIQISGYATQENSEAFVSIFGDMVKSIKVGQHAMYHAHLTDHFPLWLHRIHWDDVMLWGMVGLFWALVTSGRKGSATVSGLGYKSNVNIRRITRYYNIVCIFLVLFVIALGFPGVYVKGVVVILRMLIAVVLLIPMVLSAIVLGSDNHKWTVFALRGNQILFMVSVLATIWFIITDNAQPFGAVLFLFSGMLNWVVIAKNQ